MNTFSIVLISLFSFVSLPPAEQPAHPQKEPVQVKSEPATVSLPDWLKIGAQYRGRVESTRSIATSGGDADAYYLNRLRFRATAVAANWLSGTVEVHDTRVGDYNALVAPRGYTEKFDLRQAFIRLGTRAGKGIVALQVGRQELTLGEGRMISSPDWGNASRTYDIARFSADRPGFRLDAFGGTAVLVDASKFDRAVPGEHIYGMYTVISRLGPGIALEPYVFVRHNNIVTGERGDRGNSTVTTYGVRSTHKLGFGFYAMTETGIQDGHVASDAQRAWATNAQLAWAVPHAPAGLRVAVDYNVASGDSAYRDGRSNTWDQFYTTFHGLRGLADQFGFRNVRHVAASLDLSPSRTLKVNFAVRKLALNTVNDSFYNTSGSRMILNRRATSRDLGWELDESLTWTAQKYVTIGAGLGTILTGDFIAQSNGPPRYYYPYVYWTTKF